MRNKAQFVKEPYSGNVLKLKEELVNSIGERFTLNEMYTHKNGCKWLINNRGYIHVWKRNKIRSAFNDERCIYLITHYRITNKDKLHEVGYASYVDRESAEKAFAEL